MWWQHSAGAAGAGRIGKGDENGRATHVISWQVGDLLTFFAAACLQREAAGDALMLLTTFCWRQLWRAGCGREHRTARM